MLLLLSVLAATAAADTFSLPWAPVREIEPAAIVVHRQPAVPLVSLRLSVLADDPPGYAGAGHLIQHVMEPSLQERVSRVGGELEFRRTSDAVVYSVTGAASELGYLADVLKRALRVGPATPGAYLAASRALREERLAEWETAASHVRSALRVQLFPDDVSAAGTEWSAERLQPDLVPALWAAMYRPDRVALVAAGDVTIEEVRAAFSDLPPGGEEGALPAAVDTVSGGAPVPAEATNGWYAVAYRADEAGPAALSVAARLLQSRLERRLPGARIDVEHWWTHHGQAVALVAAAPAPLLPAVHAELDAALASLAGDLTEEQVREAGRTLRRELLFYARTPDRIAALLGGFLDRSGDATDAQTYYAALESVSLETVEELLDELRDASAARAEIPPQETPAPAPQR